MSLASDQHGVFPALGVCYYPEHWPEDMWESDAKAMVAAGITWVRIAEFSWSRIELERGVFSWGWLDRAVKILGDAGLKITMCTPTATPPKWLIDEMPDMIAIEADDTPRRFGSRRHYCFSHAGYRAESRRITEAIATRYGQIDAVAAWQTDNEYGCHDTIFSYSKAAKAGFQVWLADRYKSISMLNKAWGNVFWSMELRDFNEIELPNLTVTEANPAHSLDFRRYSTAAVVAFNHEQTNILRQLSPGRPIAHNYMGEFAQFDHRPVAADLDIASWDSYPLGMLQNMQTYPSANATRDQQTYDDCMRTGEPDFQAFHHDLYRGMGRLWIMEQQPGPVNWAKYNPVPQAGAVRMWSWEAIAHGAELVSYFRWRQPPFAQEQMHAGLMLRNDEPATGLAEAKQFASELGLLGGAETSQSAIALIHDYEADWISELDGQSADFAYLPLMLDFYRAIRRQGGSVDIIGPYDDISGYALVIIPCLMHVPDSLANQIENFDGQLLIGPRTGAKTIDFQLPENLAPGPLASATGVKITRVDALPASQKIQVSGDELSGNFTIWRELAMAQGTVLATGDDGYPALIKSNRTSYLAGWPDAKLADNIIGKAMQNADIVTHEMPSYLRVRQRGNKLIFVNYGGETATIPDSFSGIFILGTKDVPAAGVSIMQID